MTTIDETLDLLNGTDSVKDFAIKRIKGEDTRQFGSRWLSENPEDILIPILNDHDHDDYRKSVLDAWRYVYSEVIGSLEISTTALEEPHYNWIISLSRVAELAHPQELRGAVGRLLSATMENPNCDPELIYEILSAWRGYGPTIGNLEIIENLILKERFASAAFDMLTKISPPNDLIEKHLFQLWSKKYKNDWQVDIPFLVAGAKEALTSTAPIVRVLRKIIREYKDIWPAVVTEIKKLSEDINEKWPLVLLQQACDDDVGSDIIKPSVGASHGLYKSVAGSLTVAGSLNIFSQGRKLRGLTITRATNNKDTQVASFSTEEYNNRDNPGVSDQALDNQSRVSHA